MSNNSWALSVRSGEAINLRLVSSFQPQICNGFPVVNRAYREASAQNDNIIFLIHGVFLVLVFTDTTRVDAMLFGKATERQQMFRADGGVFIWLMYSTSVLE